MAEPTPPWHETFSRYAFMFFTLAMGAMIGACAAVYFGQIKMQVELANMLGGILGALVGALGAGLIAIWLYQKERFEKLRPLATRLLYRCRMTQLALEMMPDELSPNSDADNMDLIAPWIEKFREERVANEGLPLGGTINQMLEEISARIDSFERLTSSEEFDTREASTMNQVRQLADQILQRLKDLQPALSRIANSD